MTIYVKIQIMRRWVESQADPRPNELEVESRARLLWPRLKPWARNRIVDGAYRRAYSNRRYNGGPRWAKRPDDRRVKPVCGTPRTV